MQNVAICASGPSLKVSDCALLSNAGIPLITVNSSWRAAPQCQYIYAGDLGWWDKNFSAIASGAEKWTCNLQASTRYGLNLFETDTSGTFNSGQRAILFAASLGAQNIILLGYDCSIANGLHWHGAHAELDNPTAKCIERWQGEFSILSNLLPPNVNVTNCSRQTSLACFTRASLEDAIRDIHEPDFH
ncbi:hypothetical protein KFO32_15655 [Pantoea ananatis]|uniref:hypothetical protein n=1 Tax=Pantoea ananas TaxID=553 RepID=UPI001FF6F010|nr:hypothetical protein [Pantoea ananatis]MCK0554483.1 hypothetical protein [Pantoea ananatis]